MIPSADRLRGQWLEARGKPECRLLRLAILRELHHEIHSGISRVTAGSGDSLALKILQPGIEALRDARRLPEDWDALFRPSSFLDGAPGAKPSPATPEELAALLPPAGVTEAIGRDKLLRYDRKWEAALAAEARHAGWRFWTAERELPLAEVGRLNDDLVRELWPRGIVLFCEPAPREARPGHWRGRWYLAARPEVSPPTTSEFDGSCFAPLAIG
jgi:hypothetical protein